MSPHKLGGVAGVRLAHAARDAFISGMGLGLVVAAIVALAGAAIAFAILPGRGAGARELGDLERGEAEREEHAGDERGGGSRPAEPVGAHQIRVPGD